MGIMMKTARVTYSLHCIYIYLPPVPRPLIPPQIETDLTPHPRPPKNREMKLVCIYSKHIIIHYTLVVHRYILYVKLKLINGKIRDDHTEQESY